MRPPVKRLWRAWDISLHKGDTFRAVFGLKLALKIAIEPGANGTLAKASIGVWGQQVIPTLLTLFVAWPVLVARLWGLVRQSKLDDEAIACIECNLIARAQGTAAAAPSQAPIATAAGAAGPFAFCTRCGGQLPAAAKFCPHCGGRWPLRPQL